jgi:hypothetical protein
MVKNSRFHGYGDKEKKDAEIQVSFMPEDLPLLATQSARNLNSPAISREIVR